jgi:hypothetical protein
MYVSEKIRVVETPIGKSVVSIDRLVRHEVVLLFDRKFRRTPTSHTLQISENIHLIATDMEAEENFINHSCDPNGYINFSDLSYRALRPVKPGEELTFNYLTTEWDMANPFHCGCIASSCFGDIRGLKYLTEEQQLGLARFLSPYLSMKLAEVVPRYAAHIKPITTSLWLPPRR